MRMRYSLLIFAALAFLPLQSPCQSIGLDTAPRALQGWLDFLVQDSSLASVINRIGQADEEKSANKIAPNAEMYIWHDRFRVDATKDGNLQLIAVPDEDPVGRRMMVVAILDPNRRRGIYLPWARRYVQDVPRGNYMSRYVLSTLADF